MKFKAGDLIEYRPEIKRDKVRIRYGFIVNYTLGCYEVIWYYVDKRHVMQVLDARTIDVEFVLMSRPEPV